MMFCSISAIVSKYARAVSTRSFSSGRAHPDYLLSLRNFSSITPALEKELDLYSKKKQTSVSLKSLMESGRGDNPNLPSGRATKASERVLMQVACFLHREMPVRLAHRAVKLEQSPMYQMSGTQCTWFILHTLRSVIVMCSCLS
jgi:hypothetical protein